MMTGAWSERLCSVEAQEAEKERKVGVGERLGNKLTLGQYKKENIGEFYGTYYGQLASSVKPDNIIILSNDLLNEVTTYNFETQKDGSVYDRKDTKDI